jgi:hypothetical protein
LTNNPCPSSTSNVIQIQVDPKVVLSPLTANVTSPSGSDLLHAICVTTEKIMTLSSGYAGNIQWQVSSGATASSTSGFVDISGANDATLHISNPTLGMNYYRVKLTSGACASANTTALSVYYKSCINPNSKELEEVTNSEKGTFDALIYPNPFNEYFNLELNTENNEEITIKVFDIFGKLVSENRLNPMELADYKFGSDLSNQEYIVFIAQNNKVVIKKVVKF